jgi:hypothetical protein
MLMKQAGHGCLLLGHKLHGQRSPGPNTPGDDDWDRSVLHQPHLQPRSPTRYPTPHQPPATAAGGCLPTKADPMQLHVAEPTPRRQPVAAPCVPAVAVSAATCRPINPHSPAAWLMLALRERLASLLSRGAEPLAIPGRAPRMWWAALLSRRTPCRHHWPRLGKQLVMRICL